MTERLVTAGGRREGRRQRKSPTRTPLQQRFCGREARRAASRERCCGRRLLPLVPTFRSSCYTAAPAFHELRKVMGYSQTYDSSAAFLFDVPGSNVPHVMQERQIGGTSAANLKFLSGSPQVRHRNFKFEAALDINELLELL